MTDLKIMPALDPVENLRQCAEDLRIARLDFAEAFVRAHAMWKGKTPLTDRKAQEMARVATKDRVMTAQAEYQIASWLLNEHIHFEEE